MEDKFKIMKPSDILNIQRKDISQSLIRYLFANTDKGVRFKRTQLLVIPKGHYYNNSNPIKTSMGNYILNLYIFNENIYKIIGFINKRITGDVVEEIESELASNLLEGTLTSIDVIDYLNRIQFIGFGLNSTMSTSLTKAVMFELPAVKKRKQELLNKYKKELDEGNIPITEAIEKELLTLAKKEIGNDPGMELYESGSKASFNNNYKLMNIMKGAVRTSDGNFTITADNYNTGVSKKDHSTFANAMIDGQYSKSVGTQVGGYTAKKFTAAFQSVTLNKANSDCGTKKIVRIKITKFNSQILMYRKIKVANKIVTLDKKTMQTYIGKEVDLYDPIYCCGDKICNKCAGDLYYKLGILNIGVTAPRIGTTILNKLLKKFHDNTVKLYTITDVSELLL